MTVTLLGEDPAGQRGTNQRGTRTYTRVFKLETSEKTEGVYAVGSAAGLPLIGSPHPEDPFAYCVSLTPECNNPWKGWIATAEYSSAIELSENPHLDPVQITWSTEQYQEVAYKDRNGKAILNSAGDYFTDPPPMRDRSRPIVTVEKNMTTVPSWILSVADKVNTASFGLDGVTIGAGLAKVQRVTVGPKETRNGAPFRRVSLEIHLNADGWALEPLDAGYRHRNDDGELVKIVNKGDQADPSAPVLLDGTGKVLEDPTTETAVYRTFNVYSTFNFALLPLT